MATMMGLKRQQPTKIPTGATRPACKSARGSLCTLLLHMKKKTALHPCRPIPCPLRSKRHKNPALPCMQICMRILLCLIAPSDLACKSACASFSA